MWQYLCCYYYYNHFMVLWTLSGTTQGELVPEETFTHSHLSWSSIIPYLLPPSFTIHGILAVQFTCLTVFFHNLSLASFLWSTSWHGTLHFILHTFLHPIIVFFCLLCIIQYLFCTFPCGIWLLGATQVTISNGISIDSAVLSGFTVVTITCTDRHTDTQTMLPIRSNKPHLNTAIQPNNCSYSCTI